MAHLLRFLAIIAIGLPTEEKATEKGTAPGRPPAIRTEGVPEIPEEVFKGLQRYQNFRPVAFLDWAPRGGILVSRRVGAVSQLYQCQAKVPPRALTSGADPVTFGAYLPDGSILFSRCRGGDENYQIYRLEAPGKIPRLLTDGKSRNLLCPPAPRGNRVAFGSNKRNGRDLDLYLLDLASVSEPELFVEARDEIWSVEDWSEGGSQALLLRTSSSGDSQVFLMDLSTRKRSPLPPETARKGEARRSVPRLGPGARSVYLVTDARGEFLELARLDLETGRYLWLTEDLAGDVEELEISRDGKLAAFSLNDGGHSRLFVLSLDPIEKRGSKAAMEARKEVSLHAVTISRLRFSPDGSEIGFSMASASTPPEVGIYFLESGDLKSWVFGKPGGLSPGDLVTPLDVEYPTFDGRKIPACIYWPPGSHEMFSGRKPALKHPVLIFVHGGPEAQYRPAFSPLVQYLACELRIAIIAPNVRGSTGYGKTFASLDDGKLREDSVKDIGALLDWIASHKFLDASRVAILGSSYGGYMVLASMIRHGARIKAGIDVAGMGDLVAFLAGTSPHRREFRRAEYGDEEDPEMRKFLQKISPAARLGEIRSPLLVIHGANDPRVPLSESEKVVAMARKSGRPVWAVYAQDEGHGFSRHESTDYQDAVIALFLKAYLLPEPPPSR